MRGKGETGGDAPPDAGFSARPGPFMPHHALLKAFFEERERWALWLPVAFGAGISLYLALLQEPPLWLVPTLLGAVLLLPVLAGKGRRHTSVLFAMPLAAVVLGMGTAQLRAHLVSAPVLEAPLGAVTVSGRIIGIEPRNGAARVVLADLGIEGLSPEQTPRRVRVSLGGGWEELRAGVRISLRADLMPPPEPAAPGAFNFPRHAWFMGLGGVGYGVGPWRVIAAETPRAATGPWRNVSERIAVLRQRVTSRVLAVVDGEAGAVAAALITGHRGAIPDDLMAAYRDSGIAHLLAISGLHMSLVAGLVFVGLRRVLALFPWLALRIDAKKAAAVAALLAAAGYLALAGAPVPTQRAFVMCAVVLTAVLFDRVAISMRLVGVAAVAVLLVQPQSVTGPSFQMSFAAVVALVAVYERLRGPLSRGGEGWRTLWLYPASVALTTVVATMATMPFALYHFNRIAVYSVLTNLVAVPVTGFWIMPWAMAALALMPFGLDGLALVPMEWGLKVVNAAARHSAALPGAVVGIAAMTPVALAAAALGGLWLCLWRGPWRWAGTVPCLLAVASPVVLPPPDLLVAGDARIMAVRGEDGSLRFSEMRREAFTRRVWLGRNGETGAGRSWHDETRDLRCDSSGCVFLHPVARVALSWDAAALVEDCLEADLVISRAVLPVECPAPLGSVGRFELWRAGAHAVRLEGGSARIRTVRETMGNRPWTPVRWQDPQ